MVSVAARWMILPTAVEPVNEILATSGCVLNSAPTTSPRPVTILTMPAGNRAAWIASVTILFCIGLSSLGLITDVQPAAMAIANLLQIEPAVLFHGVMRAATPTG